MRLLFIGVLACLTACSSTGLSTQEAPRCLESLEMTYSGAISREGLPEGTSFEPPSTTSSRMVDVRVQVFAVEERALGLIMSGGNLWLRADRLERAEVDPIMAKLLDAGCAERTINARVKFWPGGQAYISAYETIRYVDSLSPQVPGNSTVGDPPISHARDGFMMEISAPEDPPEAEEQPRSSAIHVRLCMAELQRPIQTQEGTLPGSGGPVSLQVPVISTQEIGLDATLDTSDVILVGPLPGFSGEDPMLVFISLGAGPEGDADPLDSNPDLLVKNGVTVLF